MFGGGQEFGLRPGTLPVPLVVGLGTAAKLALAEAESRWEQCQCYRDHLLQALCPLHPIIHGDPRHYVPHIVNLSFPGIDGEVAIQSLRNIVAISNGAACTSQCQVRNSACIARNTSASLSTTSTGHFRCLKAL